MGSRDDSSGGGRLKFKAGVVTFSLHFRYIFSHFSEMNGNREKKHGFVTWRKIIVCRL